MKIRLLAIACALTIFLTGCGNMDVMGIGNFTFNKVHVDTHGYSGCIEIKRWVDNSTGIEVETKDYGAIYLSEGTYVLIEDKCPFCSAKG